MLARARVIARHFAFSPHFHCGQARRRPDDATRGGRGAPSGRHIRQPQRCGGAGGRHLQTARSLGARRGLRVPGLHRSALDGG
eukprot:1854821-Prymnesium_polylepis.1